MRDLHLNIQRSKRKTLSIYIERDGSITVRAPQDISEEKLEASIKSKAYLIHKHLAHWKLLNASKVDREYVSGESFLYLGRNYALDLVDEQARPLLLKNGRFLLHRRHQAKAKEHFIQFYKEKGLHRLKARIAYFQRAMGVQPKEIKLQELQNRWASCMPNGNLNFHWKCMMAPLSVLDYIIVHELTHLVHMNHSPEFWNEIDKVMPGYQQQITWLREHGAGMDL